MNAATRNRATSNAREKTKSPAVRRERSLAAAHADHKDDFDIGSLGDISKEVSHYLSSLNTSS
jgi:hypothetical protein